MSEGAGRGYRIRVSGGAILNIYDALYKHSDEITHILTSHEQGAAHAADGYARATGRVGVCLATSGPGATNLVTGIATAQMDSVPIVAITSNVAVGPSWAGQLSGGGHRRSGDALSQSTALLSRTCRSWPRP